MAEKVEPRIISVGGVVTELLFGLGLEENIVAVDSSSTFPDRVKSLPQVGYNRALSTEGILSLKPDLLVLTESAGPPVVIEQLKASSIRIVKIQTPQSTDSLIGGISTLGKELKRESEAQELVNKIEADLGSFSYAGNTKKVGPKVMFIMHHGLASPMVAGVETNASRMIELAGGVNAVSLYEGYRPFTPESSILHNPDFIITTSEISEILALQGFSSIRAVKEEKIIKVDTLEFLGFGPRSIKLAKTLNESFK